jgi:ketosteroid isomerase-like protein
VSATALVVLGGGSLPGQERSASVNSLVETERAFATLSGKVGHIPAFLAYFADDVVTFGPAPRRGKEALRAAAARTTVPPAVSVDWEPWFADLAAAGDLGYTTGPSIFRETATGQVTRTGWYFSVWRHDSLGWRVAADIGIAAPPAGALRPRVVEAGSSAREPGAPGGTREDIVGLDRALADAMARSGVAKAYAPLLAASTRVHRDGTAPVVGAAAVEEFLAGEAAPLACRTVDAAVSARGDFAYSLGECDIAPAPGTSTVKAGYLRVWKSGPRGWRLAADVVTR